MKKVTSPGFEFIFSIALFAILGLPLLVLAQSTKNIEIKIINSDTTVNGKDIKKLSATERRAALAELDNLPLIPVTPDATGNTNANVTIKKSTNGNNKNNVIIERSITRSDQPEIAGMDSSRKDVKVHLRKLRGADSVQAFSYRFDNDLPPMDMKTFSFDIPKHKQGFEFTSRNTQNFNYTNTDNDGITTNISFHVADATKETAKRVAGTENAQLTLNDLNLLPEFSTGKTTLLFNLDAKTIADVKLTNTRGTVLWADKATAGNFSKKINLPLNGAYYLIVKQGTAVAVKKIIKE